MVFSSLKFIFIFMPIFFYLYYCLKPQYKNGFLLLGSIVFYSVGTWDKPLHILLVLASLLVNFLLGKAIGKSRKKSRLLLFSGVVYNFLWLLLFKYADFIFSGINKLLPLFGSEKTIPELGLVLPIGISFYTFQAVSYLIDVYRGTIQYEKSIVNFGTYITMFPQLIAGPIVTYSQVSEKLHSRKIYIENLVEGLKTFIIGLGLKVIIANPCGKLWGNISVIGYESVSFKLAWIGIIAYSFQIYFDFYGYSVMAIGLGKMLGFDIPENFNNPYISHSMTEFWRRWHITLSTWFKDYLYIPLGGNRKGKYRTILNLLIVWLATGIWHGAGLNFILWGLFLFFFIMLEKLFLKKYLDKIPVIGNIYMLILIPVSWAIFEIPDIGNLGIFLTRLFPFFGTTGNVFEGDWLIYLKDYWYILVAALLLATGIPKKIFEKFRKTFFGTVVAVAIFLGSVYLLNMGLNDPFLYFRF